MSLHSEPRPSITASAYAALERRVDEQSRMISQLRETNEQHVEARIANLRATDATIAELRANISILVDEKAALEERLRETMECAQENFTIALEVREHIMRQPQRWQSALDGLDRMKLPSLLSAQKVASVAARVRAGGAEVNPATHAICCPHEASPVADGPIAQRFDEPSTKERCTRGDHRYPVNFIGPGRREDICLDCGHDNRGAPGLSVTRSDAMDLCKCGHIRRVHEGNVCLACASTSVSGRKALPTHEFAQSSDQFEQAFTAAREADVYDEPDVAGAWLASQPEVIEDREAEVAIAAQRSEHAVTEAEHLHAAQLAARAHVSPHIRAAAAALAKSGGDPNDAFVYLALADAIDGQYDGVIIRVLRAVIRFTEGGR